MNEHLPSYSMAASERLKTSRKSGDKCRKAACRFCVTRGSYLLDRKTDYREENLCCTLHAKAFSDCTNMLCCSNLQKKKKEKKSLFSLPSAASCKSQREHSSFYFFSLFVFLYSASQSKLSFCIIKMSRLSGSTWLRVMNAVNALHLSQPLSPLALNKAG